MFIYLFLLAAAATCTELPINDDTKDIQELIAVLSTEAPSTDVATIAETTISSESIITPTSMPITITNAIDADMLKYKHWTGTYSPEIFTVQIDGTEVAQGAQHTIPAETKTIDVMFSYSFMNGMRTGSKTVSYQLNENITQANITFSWKEDRKILVDNGTLLKVTA